MIGVVSNVYRVLVPPPLPLPRDFFEATGMFEIAVSPPRATIDMSNVALAPGSSKHGKARLASAASNCVVARRLVLPPPSLYSLR